MQIVGPAWRVEARATPFHPWVSICPQWRLEAAIKEAARLKAAHSFYSTRVRAN